MPLNHPSSPSSSSLQNGKKRGGRREDLRPGSHEECEAEHDAGSQHRHSQQHPTAPVPHEHAGCLPSGSAPVGSLVHPDQTGEETHSEGKAQTGDLKGEAQEGRVGSKATSKAGCQALPHRTLTPSSPSPPLSVLPPSNKNAPQTRWAAQTTHRAFSTRCRSSRKLRSRCAAISGSSMSLRLRLPPYST